MLYINLSLLFALFFALGFRKRLVSLVMRSRQTRRSPKRSGVPRAAKAQPRANRPKPAWVRREIVRLKALMPHDGCRRIADVFNFRFEERRGVTVGKTFVADTIRKHKLEILRVRRQLKHRKPHPMRRNLVWGLDLTYIDQRPVFGVIDHGSRACLRLEQLPAKSTIAILRVLLDTVEKFGRPKILRTDNEATFRSRLFSAALGLLRIRHQRTDPHAPWQNGRIERFFGTLKRAIRAWQPVQEVQQEDLNLFRLWYNHVREHQHLQGQTPAQVWDDRTRSRRKRRRFFSAWGGVLAGYLR